MGMYSAIPYIISRLRDIPELTDAVITEDFTSPSVCRPVLRTTASVGVREFSMDPSTRYTHRMSSVMRITLLFPCGLGDSDISDIVYKVSAAFVGRVYYYSLVESISVSNPAFNSSLYGVMAEVDLHMKSTVTLSDPSRKTSESESFSVGDISFTRLPDRVTESREKGKELPMSKSPRTFTVEGAVEYSAAGAEWNRLHAVMASDSSLQLTLPRSTRTVTVRPESIETEGDLCGYGFSYKLTFVEVI